MQLKTLINTIPNLDCDIDHFVTKITSKEAHEVDVFDKIDLFAPLEIFECQSMIDYMLESPNELQKIINDKKRGKENYSLIGKLVQEV
jgi:hypothetical protein